MYSYPLSSRILLAIDCIIFGFDGKDIKLLLIKRNFEPELGKWSLMGGFLKEEEDLEAGASRILYDLTGLKDIYVEQLEVFGKVNRDPAERTVSVVFFALIQIEEHDAEAVRSHNASWISLDKRPQLIFDHEQMVMRAIEHLRYKAALHPIGFELLPEYFSIPQLQKLYEAIYNTPLDRRNFSRKLLSTGLLIDTGHKNSNSTTKKATLYKLDTVRYKEKFHAFWNFMPDSMKPAQS
ncbi:NUDIX hydrolase [Dyadobacter diqingensis]|uniref:NUDIX hydrolase n=1 Tax=Dyadobacter diqingensis TaxID=2938121 RepID=UPI0020C2B6E3|nr:NUDIX domain-containing protein [Dyadobacter diqingensis]